jgi:hypothetical protein
MRIRVLLQAVVVVVTSAALLDLTGVLVGVAVAAGLVLEGPERMSRHAAVAAAACLLAAGFATVLERDLAPEPRFDFAVGRPVASALGAVAGILLVQAVLCGWFANAGRSPG